MYQSSRRKWTIFIFLLLIAPACLAKVFYSKSEAMELAFGKAPVETLSLFPEPEQIVEIQKQARVPLDSGLFTFYVGKEQDKILGYAAIETNTVRTKPETLLIVLTPEGQLRAIYTLAFHEPPEYMPPEQWYTRLYQRSLEEMDFNKGVDGISGATLSTRSAVNSVRKVMAIYQILVKTQDKP